MTVASDGRTAPGVWRRLGKRLIQPFPEVDGNRVRSLHDAAASFRIMLDAIRAAQTSVDLEMYLWDDDDLGRRFQRALSEAAKRGVRVRVLVDGFGASEVTGSPLRRVEEAGAAVRVFNPVRWYPYRRMFRRTHKKLLILDGCTGFCGGTGFSEVFLSGKSDERPWHDRMYQLSGPIVGQLITQFEVDFARWGPREGKFGSMPALGCASESHASVLTPKGSARGRVLRGWPDGRDFPSTLLKRLHGAHTTIRIGTPYFVPRVRLLLALMRALKRGVRVQLIVPAPEFSNLVLWHGGRRYLAPLLKRGAEVRLYGESFYHAKIAVIDQDVAIIGSSNLDGWSWRRNAELDLCFTDGATAQSLTTDFESDWLASRPFTPELFRGGGAWNVFAAWIAERVRRWL